MGAIIQKILIGLKQDRLAISLVVGFVICAAMVRLSFGFTPIRFSAFLVNLYIMIIALLLIAALWILFRLGRVRPASPIGYLRNDPTLRHVVSRIPLLTPILLATAVFMPAFSAMKSLVGMISPYSWDQLFIDWDIAIHGDHPWKLMQPMIGEAWVTASIALIYQIWILYVFLGFPLVCFWKGNAARRQQMLVAYFLCWILIGSVMANYLASVGPFGLENLKGNATFTPLMEYLRQSGTIYPVLTLDVQDTLLRWHHSRDDGLGRGISAMPSMHVSIALLFAIFGWHVSRWIGALLTAVFFLILIGSVHLGYHYAVDGYVAIVATVMIWLASGWLVRRWPSRSLPEESSSVL